jgi:hypothetical protein
MRPVRWPPAACLRLRGQVPVASALAGASYQQTTNYRQQHVHLVVKVIAAPSSKACSDTLPLHARLLTDARLRTQARLA